MHKICLVVLFLLVGISAGETTRRRFTSSRSNTAMVFCV